MPPLPPPSPRPPSPPPSPSPPPLGLRMLSVCSGATLGGRGPYALSAPSSSGQFGSLCLQATGLETSGGANIALAPCAAVTAQAFRPFGTGPLRAVGLPSLGGPPPEAQLCMVLGASKSLVELAPCATTAGLAEWSDRGELVFPASAAQAGLPAQCATMPQPGALRGSPASFVAAGAFAPLNGPPRSDQVVLRICYPFTPPAPRGPPPPSPPPPPPLPPANPPGTPRAPAPLLRRPPAPLLSYLPRPPFPPARTPPVFRPPPGAPKAPPAPMALLHPAAVGGITAGALLAGGAGMALFTLLVAGARTVRVAQELMWGLVRAHRPQLLAGSRSVEDEIMCPA